MAFERQVAKILADRESGSTQLVQHIQEAFHSIGSSAPDVRRLRWAFTQLRKIDQSMVVVHHLLDTLEPAVGPAFFQSLLEYEQHWAQVPDRVATQLIQARDWSNRNILAHSRSGMLQEAARRLNEHYGGLKVWQTRSEPGGEGVSQFRDLQKLNVTTHLIEDDQVEDFATSVDAAWLGADQYSEEAFVNKVGSRRIIDAMSRAGKTTFVLGDPRKRVNSLNFTTTLFEAIPISQSTYLVDGT